VSSSSIFEPFSAESNKTHQKSHFMPSAFTEDIYAQEKSPIPEKAEMAEPVKTAVNHMKRIKVP